MVRGKQFLFLLALIAVLVVSVNLVSATMLNAPFNVSFGNYSTTITINCSTDTVNATTTASGDGTNSSNIAGLYNVSIYYNVSGGAAGVNGAEGTYLTTIQSSEENQTYFQAIVSISSLSSALFAYNFSCMADNLTDKDWSSTEFISENITIINTPAHINVTDIIILNSSLDEHNNYANISGNFSFNVSVNLTLGGAHIEEFGYLDSVYFNLSLNGVQDLFWQGSTSRELQNSSLDSIDNSFSDSYQGYSLCIFANDTLSNINNTECYTITIDNNAPAVSLTKNTAQTTTDSITLTIDPGESGTGLNGDCTTNRGTISALSITARNLNCGEPYSFTVTCTDYMNFQGSATTSFSTNDCGTSAPSGGGTTITGTTYTISETQFKTGFTKQISINDQIKFTIGTSKHTLRASSISADKVTITLSSTPQTATLAIGDIRRFDTNADGVYDVEVKLNSITSGKADLTIKETSVTVAEETKAAEEEAEKAKQAEAAQAANLTWLWIILAVVAIAIIIYFIYKKKK